jgi:sec-independent protein translocase protein TatB
MFFDIAWPELMLIAIVALVVIGPKDLPAALRVAGIWLRKARSMSREFHSSVEQMIRDAELDEVQKELKKATEIDLDHEINKIMDPAVATAITATPANVPDYLDTTPAADVPMTADPTLPAQIEANDEPELPLLPPEPARAAEPEPAQAARSPAVDPPRP